MWWVCTWWFHVSAVVFVLVDEHHSQSAFLKADAVLQSDSSVCIVRRDASRACLLDVHLGWRECAM